MNIPTSSIAYLDGGMALNWDDTMSWLETQKRHQRSRKKLSPTCLQEGRNAWEAKPPNW